MQRGQRNRLNQLSEALYDAVVDPAGWGRIVPALGDCFSAHVGALYFLDFGHQGMRPLYQGGVPPSFLQSFSSCFFTPDNPWIRVDDLHRPGVVRTDQRLLAHLRDARILERSFYYNEWMRPQSMKHTIGATLLIEGRRIGNLTLLRSADVGSFGAQEIRAFARFAGHARRALRVAMRLDAATAEGRIVREALDCLPYGVVVVDVRGRLLHANAVAEALVAARDGLTVHHGRLVAVETGDRWKLEALLRRVAALEPMPEGPAGSADIRIGRAESDRPFTVSAVRLSSASRALVGRAPAILLLIAAPEAIRPASTGLLRDLYGLTEAEARLARALVGTQSLKQAADESGMTYETARWYLKLLFQKTETNRQAALVARLLHDRAVPLTPRRLGSVDAAERGLGARDPARASPPKREVRTAAVCSTLRSTPSDLQRGEPS